ncbi:MAG: hypothetical protein U0610_12465 [bacterium]
METPRSGARGRWMWIVVLVFAVLHWDFWLWDDTSLWFGFLPAGLGYHAFYSLGAGLLWAAFIALAWPEHIEAWANSADAPPSLGSSQHGEESR